MATPATKEQARVSLVPLRPKALSPKVRLGGVFLGAAFAVCYGPVVATLVRQWWGNDAYSHGFLIPFVSLYIVWVRRSRLAGLATARGSATGFLAIAFGLLLLLAGRAVSVVVLQELSIVATLAGAVLLLFGFTGLHVFWFPIGYLLFMIPFWDVLTERLHYPLQFLSASIGRWVLTAVGVPVLQQGTYLYLPNITLEVAKVCSGVNYLVAVIAVGMPLAYLTLRSDGRRLLLVTGATGIAVLANPVRVALIGFLAYYGLSENLHGPWHALQGLFVASAGYVALLVGAWLLGRGQGPARRPTEAPVPSQTESIVPAGSRVLVMALAASVALVAAAWSSPENWVAAPGEVPEAVRRLALDVSGWTSWDSEPPPALLAAGLVPQPGEVYRTYEGARGERLDLYIGAFSRRVSDGRGSRYASDRWDTNATSVVLTLGGGVGEVRAKRLALRSGGSGCQLTYWFTAGDLRTSSRVKAKIYELRGRLRRGPRPLAIVLVEEGFDAPPGSAPSPQAARFALEVLPALLQRLEASGGGLR